MLQSTVRLSVIVACLVAVILTPFHAADDPPRPSVLIPQVWVDASANVFHAPGCKKINDKMTRVARTVAKMQGVPAAAECSETDAQAKERWKAFAEKETAGGFSDFGETVKPRKERPDENKTSARTEEPRAGKPRRDSEPRPASHNEVMAASNFYDARDVIARKCSQQWGGNSEMVSYCVDKQLEAVARLDKGRPFGADPEKWGTVRVKCAQQWPTDYSMRVYCEGKAGF